MRKPTRRPGVLALLALLATSFFVATPGLAIAAESVPELQWPATDVGRRDNFDMVESTTGSMTLPCSTNNGGQDLVSYSATGQIIRQLSRTQVIDGVPNCINNPTVDKNDHLYGIPAGFVNGYYTKGPNLLAYNGNTLMWKYPLSCGNDTSPSLAVGADGNIYATAWLSDGMHLIGLKPNLAAGQSQPTKVFDVKTSNDCSSQVYAYKDGIMLHGQSSGNPRYYSYSGKYLGQATIGSIWDEKINAEGQLFVRSNVAGSGFTSVSVSKYDPRAGAVQWTTSASRPGADTNGTQLRPLPNGGVVALIKQQKMVSDGVPASPKEWVMVLVTIDANGQKIRSWELPNKTGQDTFGGTYFSSDTNGNVTVMRVLNLKTSVSWPTTVPAIAVGVYDPMNGAWSNEFVMQGDLQKPGGPSDYWLDTASDEHAITTTSGTLSIVAHCSNNCANNHPMLYPIKVSGLGNVYPRGAVLSANTGAQPAPRSYMALGDSFSSGEGVPPFIDETACHRSALAYSRVNGLNTSTTLQLDKFVACGGARTTHVLNGWTTDGHNELPQVNALSSGSPKVATITIGGNDIRFGEFALACILDTCNFSSGVYANSLNEINNTLEGKLETTYKKLLEVTKTPGTKIYVLGYPQVIADKSVNEIGDARCPYMYESVPVAAGRYWEDARAARDIVTKLNAKIDYTVSKVRALDPDNQRLTFISVTDVSSPFSGHEICGSEESYFNNLDQVGNDPAYVFHPNKKGQEAYAQLALLAIEENNGYVDPGGCGNPDFC